MSEIYLLIDGQGTPSVYRMTLIILIPFFLKNFFLGPHLRHMKVLRLGVESELQLPTYTTAAATVDPQATECDQGSNLSPYEY